MHCKSWFFCNVWFGRRGALILTKADEICTCTFAHSGWSCNWWWHSGRERTGDCTSSRFMRLKVKPKHHGKDRLRRWKARSYGYHTNNVSCVQQFKHRFWYLLLSLQTYLHRNWLFTIPSLNNVMDFQPLFTTIALSHIAHIFILQLRVKHNRSTDRERKSYTQSSPTG